MVKRSKHVRRILNTLDEYGIDLDDFGVRYTFSHVCSAFPLTEAQFEALLDVLCAQVDTRKRQLKTKSAVEAFADVYSTYTSFDPKDQYMGYILLTILLSFGVRHEDMMQSVGYIRKLKIVYKDLLKKDSKNSEWKTLSLEILADVNGFDNDFEDLLAGEYAEENRELLFLTLSLIRKCDDRNRPMFYCKLAKSILWKRIREGLIYRYIEICGSERLEDLHCLIDDGLINDAMLRLLTADKSIVSSRTPTELRQLLKSWYAWREQTGEDDFATFAAAGNTIADYEEAKKSSAQRVSSKVVVVASPSPVRKTVVQTRGKKKIRAPRAAGASTKPVSQKTDSVDVSVVHRDLLVSDFVMDFELTEPIQIILVHGLLRVGTSSMYIGGHVIAYNSLWSACRSKFRSISEDKRCFDQALKILEKEGIVVLNGRRCYALGPSRNASEVSQSIVERVIAFKKEIHS